jgi:hypothetical protein
MTHPARRVVPNGPVGRKLQHFKCISKVACAWLCACACVPNGWCAAPLGTTSAAFELGQQPRVAVSISSFTGGSSAPARTAVAPRAPELQRPNGRQCKDGPPGSLGLGVVAGARRNGPVRPHAQRHTAGRRQHMCSALLFQQQVGGWRSRVILASQAEDPAGPAGPGELMLVLYGGPRWSFWRPPLLSEPGVLFVPRSMRSSGLLFLILRH